MLICTLTASTTRTVRVLMRMRNQFHKPSTLVYFFVFILFSTASVVGDAHIGRGIETVYYRLYHPDAMEMRRSRHGFPSLRYLGVPIALSCEAVVPFINSKSIEPEHTTLGGRSTATNTICLAININMIDKSRADVLPLLSRRTNDRTIVSYPCDTNPVRKLYYKVCGLVRTGNQTSTIL